MTGRPEMGSLTPHLCCRNAAAAIDFYKTAFDAEEMFRMPDPAGKLMHGSIAIGGKPVFLVDEYLEYGARSPLTLGGSGVTIHLLVPDVDAAFAKALAAGATTVMPVADQFWGDRYGVLEDPFGHRWSLATPVKDLTPDEIRANLAKMAPGDHCQEGKGA